MFQDLHSCTQGIGAKYHTHYELCCFDTFTKAARFCNKVRSPPASLVTKQRTVKWSLGFREYCYISAELFHLTRVLDNKTFSDYITMHLNNEIFLLREMSSFTKCKSFTLLTPALFCENAI